MKDLAASLEQLRHIWAADPFMHKTTDDLARYQDVIDLIQPAVLIETGLLRGGSAEWFSARVPHVLVAELDPALIAAFDPPANVEVFEGYANQLAPEIGTRARELGGPIMVALDSDHSTETVYDEMVAYGPYVTPGSYLVVEDGILHFLRQGPFRVGNWFDGDPLLAVNRYLAEHDEWEVDWELEDRYPTTQHPRGWLRKR